MKRRATVCRYLRRRQEEGILYPTWISRRRGLTLRLWRGMIGSFAEKAAECFGVTGIGWRGSAKKQNRW